MRLAKVVIYLVLPIVAITLFLTPIIRNEIQRRFSIAAENRDLATMKQLYRWGADVNGRWDNGYGTPALYSSAAVGDDDAVRFLIASGASVNSGGDCGHTPLMAAVSNHQETTTIALLGAGAKIDAREDVCCLDVLQMAASAGDTNLVRILVAHGADPSSRAPCEPWASALELATKNGHAETAHYLRQIGAK